MTLREEIAKVAYEIYEARGCLHGHDLDDWLEAERIVLSQHAGQAIEEPEDVDISDEITTIQQAEIEIKTRPRSNN